MQDGWWINSFIQFVESKSNMLRHRRHTIETKTATIESVVCGMRVNEQLCKIHKFSSKILFDVYIENQLYWWCGAMWTLNIEQHIPHEYQSKLFFMYFNVDWLINMLSVVRALSSPNGVTHIHSRAVQSNVISWTMYSVCLFSIMRQNILRSP